jgi:hypothetical protein
MEPFIQVSPAFGVPKAGNMPDEYEDAIAYSCSTLCCAVSDGATESSFAKEWAISLVNGFVTAPPTYTCMSERSFKEWLEPLQQQWHATIDWERLPWFAEEKARAGAFASLLGLTFVKDPPESSAISGLCCQAIAFGDSCLFHLRGGSLIHSFPLDRSEQFGNHPWLLSSNPVNNQQGLLDERKILTADVHPEDTFLLMTDALAQWFLIQHETGSKPWVALDNLHTQEEFESFIAHLRQEHSIRNDDTSLLIVRGCFSYGGNNELANFV